MGIEMSLMEYIITYIFFIILIAIALFPISFLLSFIIMRLKNGKKNYRNITI